MHFRAKNIWNIHLRNHNEHETYSFDIYYHIRIAFASISLLVSAISTSICKLSFTIFYSALVYILEN